MKNIITLLVITTLVITACNQKQPEAKAEKKKELPGKMTFYFEIDTVGNILDENVKAQLTQLAKDLNENDERIMIYGYSEQTGDEEQNKKIATDLMWAAKLNIRETCTKNYNVGHEILGYQNPINPNNPTDKVNRRVEIEYMQ